MAYVLSGAAARDLIEIERYSFEVFGERQTRIYMDSMLVAFDRIAEMPALYPLRPEIIPAVRVCPFKAHLIFFLEDADGVQVLRIRHSREDWQDD